MTSPSPAKHRIIGWRIDIEFERFSHLLKVGLWVCGLAALIIIANTVRSKSGKGWFDFIGPFGKYIIIFTSVAGKRPFTLGAAFAIAAAGFILWLMMPIIGTKEPEKLTPNNVLALPPPAISQ